MRLLAPKRERAALALATIARLVARVTRMPTDDRSRAQPRIVVRAIPGGFEAAPSVPRSTGGVQARWHENGGPWTPASAFARLRDLLEIHDSNFYWLLPESAGDQGCPHSHRQDPS